MRAHPRVEPAAAGYREMVVALAAGPPAVEVVTNFLWEEGALGVVEEATRAGVRLRAFWSPAADVAALASRTRAYLEALRALGELAGASRIAVARLADPGWADAWRAHFRPLAVGRRLLVCPPWEPPPPGLTGRLVVRIEPGRAFGTGGHATTRGCLELLERAVDAGPVARALDAGCGSGILAIAAVRLGVPRVDAIDVDPDAVAATEANARRNRIARRVRAAPVAAEAWTGPRVPLVLANLLAASHVALAPAFADLVEAGGTLVAGGILAAERRTVGQALARAGFAPVDRVERQGWVSLRLRRRGGGAGARPR